MLIASKGNDLIGCLENDLPLRDPQGTVNVEGLKAFHITWNMTLGDGNLFCTVAGIAKIRLGSQRGGSFTLTETFLTWLALIQVGRTLGTLSILDETSAAARGARESLTGAVMTRKASALCGIMLAHVKCLIPFGDGRVSSPNSNSIELMIRSSVRVQSCQPKEDCHQ